MAVTRRYFGTDGIRARVGSPEMSAPFILQLGWAVGKALQRNHSAPSVLIGKDTRISGYMLESALEAGLVSAGCNIKLLGPMPTPAIAYLTQAFHADLGIVISASHNIYADNGIKFFSAEGFKLPDAVEAEIESFLDLTLETVSPDKLGRASRVADAPGRYIEFCKSTIDRRMNFKGLRIVLDCAHGATYHIAPAVFRELGADVIEVGVDPDGMNINDACGSTEPALLKRTVELAQADIGIAFDGDGDRVICVDAAGKLMDGDDILYILANKYRATSGLLGVVGTVMSNFGLEEALRAVDIDFIRTAVGDRYVIEALQARNWMLGGETSGHIICLNKTTTGDGIVTALQVVAEMVRQNRSAEDLLRGFHKYPQALENVRLTGDAKTLLQHPAITAAVQEAEVALKQKGRVLLRASGTEPLIRVMVEAEEASLMQRTLSELVAVVKRCAAE